MNIEANTKKQANHSKFIHFPVFPFRAVGNGAQIRKLDHLNAKQ